MPQKAICGGCGYVLYEGVELKTPAEISQRYGGRCPQCNKELSISVSSIEICKVKKKE